MGEGGLKGQATRGEWSSVASNNPKLRIYF